MPMPSVSVSSQQVRVEPVSVCLQPGDVAALTMTNEGVTHVDFTYLNAWIVDRDSVTMFAAWLHPDRPETSGPLEFTTATTILPIGPIPLAPGESTAIGVMAPSDSGEYILDVWATALVRVPLTVTEGVCPNEP